MAFSRLPYNFEEALAEVKSWRASYKPDYNTEAVLVKEMQRMAKRIEDLEKSVECMCGICKLGHQRKPLTDEEVIKLKMEGRDLEFVNMTALHRFARAIEASHGIKETKE